MEGLLHPVGPEEARTYWIRRAGAALVLVFLMMGVGSVISNLGGGDTPVAAEPARTDNGESPVPAQAPTGDPSEEMRDEEAESAPTEPALPAETPAPAEPSRSATPAPASEEPLPPEPANTFHRTEQATRSGDD